VPESPLEIDLFLARNVLVGGTTARQETQLFQKSKQKHANRYHKKTAVTYTICTRENSQGCSQVVTVRSALRTGVSMMSLWRPWRHRRWLTNYIALRSNWQGRSMGHVSSRRH